MPLLLPKQRNTRRESNFTGRPSSTMGTVLTSDTVAHQYPTAYTQLIASTSFDTDWINVFFHTNFASATDTDSLVTIYVGAGGSEQVLIPHLLAGWTQIILSTTGAGWKRYGFPLRIPAGSRLSARHQSVRTSTGVTCLIELLGGGASSHWSGTQVEVVGASTAASCGTFITPGTTSEGTLTSIGTNTYEWGFVHPMQGGNTDTTLTDSVLAMDLAAGSATSNLIDGLDDFWFYASAAENAGPVLSDVGRYCHIPASTTIYGRTQSSTSAEAKDYCVYGVF